MTASRPIFLAAAWESLAMVNYEIDPAILAPLVPHGVELDLWDGKALVSVVGFMFLNTKVLGWTIPFHTNFEEVNLRFYVKRHAPDGPRRGVVFIKEIVPKHAIALVARWVYGENYWATRMDSTIRLPRAGAGEAGSIEYRWGRPGCAGKVGVEVAGDALPLVEGSQEEFITEHYWGYTSHGSDKTLEYQVEHQRWKVWRATKAWTEIDVEAVYGKPFRAALDRPPTSAFAAVGSEIWVRRGVRIA